jgi:hemerythrin superfamily protein
MFEGEDSRGYGRMLALIGGAVAGTFIVATALPAIKRRAYRVTTILKKDHRMVSGLFWTLQQTTNPHIRKSIFTQLQTQLETHAQAEEEVFYSAMRHLYTAAAERQVDEADREHQRIKDLCHEIAAIDPNSYQFMSKVNELKETVEHHVEEEETEMFRLAHNNMSNDELEHLGRRLHDRKLQIKQRTAA